MNAWAKQKQTGFTIVELLIVIVVIAILATISIVAYNGIQDRARTSTLMSALAQAAKKIAVWQVDNPGQYPALLADVGITDTSTISYQYTSSGSPASYCITATYGATSYYISDSSGGSQAGVCSGYNLVAWNKANPGATPPVPSAVVDTTTYRTSTASMRIGPNSTGKPLRGNPYSGVSGQKYTVTLWIKTDPNWDGTINNSKIRFGNSSGGALLNSCSYNGVKAAWTQVSCSYTLTSTVTSVDITVGNDGTVGNIWIDDMSVVLS